MKTKGTRTERVIKALLKHARPEILKEYRPDSCIGSTACGVDVLMHFGILAEPLPVRTAIFNDKFIARIEGGSPWPQGDEVHRWTEQDGSYSVGIGFGTGQPGKWPGHLVILAEKKYLIDLSVDQANRPQYNILVAPYCMAVNEAMIAGKELAVIPYEACGPKCVIRNEITPDNRGYLLSPDWMFKSRIQNLTTKIIAKMMKERTK